MTRAITAKNLSLRQILIASLISQVLVAVGLTGYFSWKNGRQTVEKLALRLSREVTAHTQEHVTDYLKIPTTFLNINRVFVELQQLDTNNTEELKDVFWQQAQIYPEINTIFYGSQTGNFVEIENTEPPKLMIRNQNTAPFWEMYGLDEAGNATVKLSTKKYDPRERPWYKAALEHQDLIWSPIYLFADPPVLGITPAIPLKDSESNQIKGVMAIDLTLEAISQFLNSLKISKSGRVFIIERSGKMVATSTKNSLVRRNAMVNERLHYSESLDPLVRTTASFLEEKLDSLKNIESDRQLIFQLDRQRYFVQITRLGEYPGLDWSIVTVIPESDFLSYIRRNTYTTLGLSTLALISAILLGAIANQLIIKSVNNIADVAKAISRGQVLTVEEQPKIRELVVISESIDAMALQLQNSAQNLETLESLWERRIEESTKNLLQDNQRLNRLANIDNLTQVFNRYHFDLALEELWQQTIQERGVISLIMCDVDSFKQYNDTYGHLMGDECLKQVAMAIARSANRDRDIAARYGGEEFVIILPRTHQEGAIEIAKRINNAVWELNINHHTSTVANRVTISCGVASIIPNPNLAAVNLIEKADRALYLAKEEGRNRSIFID